MLFFIAFLEGIITFISPCMLPMLPVYLSYFALGAGQSKSAHTLKNAVGFVLGFTLIFVLMGAFAGTIGGFLQRYRSILNIVTGLLVVVFGLSFVGVLKIRIFKGGTNPFAGRKLGFFSAMLFGIVFAFGWTPCVSAFLGSALMMASQQGSVLTGVFMLLTYALGLGVPFVISATLLDRLTAAFGFIKRHYTVINTVCGLFLVVVGILMMSGVFGRFLSFLS